ncbi:MAG TPA: preprotein translocase subunit Sec61beta [Methanocorpusculum sp.]|nr:preprotein translocase subunit Sec61beta [Methanocorpusculum sp.]
MAKRTAERGPSSAAGLVTYYDADDKNAIHFKPAHVLIAAAVIGIIVFIINIVF